MPRSIEAMEAPDVVAKFAEQGLSSRRNTAAEFGTTSCAARFPSGARPSRTQAPRSTERTFLALEPAACDPRISRCESPAMALPMERRSMLNTCRPAIQLMFAVRHLYGNCRNSRAHAIEMCSNPDSEPPLFFQKPTDAIQNVAPGTVADHHYPPVTLSNAASTACPTSA